MWALGVILWELVTLRPAWDDVGKHPEVIIIIIIVVVVVAAAVVGLHRLCTRSPSSIPLCPQLQFFVC